MAEGGSQDEGFSDSEVVYEEDVVEVVDLDQDRPPEDGKLTFTFGLLIVLLYCSVRVLAELQEEVEDLGMEEEAAEEAVAVRNDAMTIFRGHTGQEALKCKYMCVFYTFPTLLFSLLCFSPSFLLSLESPYPPASVFSVSLHPSNGQVCSGGEDDKAFLWRTSDASVLLECDG